MLPRRRGSARTRQAASDTNGNTVSMKIIIINGPNLGRLGQRLPEVYGHETAASLMERLSLLFQGVDFAYFQSNSEGEIIDIIEREAYAEDVRGTVINPGAYTHYSYAIADAIEAAPCPFVEVHISNIYAREEFRSRSVTAPQCRAMVAGMGIGGYEAAVRYLLICDD